ncbi:hypothetical protein E2562_005473 [Oryza meyeriana var. granulata]|uniref:O-methyltransferase dimerisation domain-containing protein n=1 Tax=Oryza meyeriana var. granulata TaxID=110450 RepID=A0A6G1DFW4_9ORYZ|nr:hypothetical protein E2562_005473 [Oryza meyeriana var. granulata]
MALQCAVKLGIPNAIHRCGGTASLSELLAVLPVDSNKHDKLARLMRFMTMSGLFACVPATECDSGAAIMTTENVYGLTPVSRILVSDTGIDRRYVNLSPFVLAVTTQYQVNAAMHLAKWFGNETTGVEEEAPETPFMMANGTDFWGIASRDPKFNEVFNDGMGSDSRFNPACEMLRVGSPMGD